MSARVYRCRHILMTKSFLIPGLLFFLNATLMQGAYCGECEQIVRAFSSYNSDAVTGRSPWPGYSPAAGPLLVENPAEGYSLLFNPKKIPAGFKKADCTSEKRVYIGKSSFTGPDYEAISLEGVKAFRVRFSDGVEKGFAFAVHEGFHVFQKERFLHRDTVKIPGTIPPVTLASAYIERQLLYNALVSADWRPYVRQFVAFRLKRYESEAMNIRRAEEEREVSEGTAKYVEIKSLRYLAGNNGGLDNADPIADLQLFFNVRMPYFMYAPYGSGLAQCLLLDRSGLDWKKAVQAGRSPFELLAEQYTADKQQIAADAADIKTIYGFKDLLFTAEEEVSSYSRGLKAIEGKHLKAVGATRVTLGNIMASVYFSSDGGVHYMDDGRMFVPSLRRLTATDPGRVKLAIAGGSVIMSSAESEGSKIRSIDFVTEDDKLPLVSVDGERWKLREGCTEFSKSITLTTTGVELNGSGSGRFCVSGNKLEVNLK